MRMSRPNANAKREKVFKYVLYCNKAVTRQRGCDDSLALFVSLFTSLDKHTSESQMQCSEGACPQDFGYALRPRLVLPSRDAGQWRSARANWLTCTAHRLSAGATGKRPTHS